MPSSDSRLPAWAQGLSRGIGYAIGGIVGGGLVVAALLICLWAIRALGSALFGWDLFA